MKHTFAVFILTNGRPNNQISFQTLRRCGYTGKIWFCLDDCDLTIQEYINNYGADNVVIFDKNYYINSIDNNVRFFTDKAPIYARCAVEDIASSLGYDTFMVIDDDVKDFRYRYIEDKSLLSSNVYNLDSVFHSISEFIIDCNLSTVGLSNSSSYIGGYSQWCNYLGSTKFRSPIQPFIRNSKFKVNWFSLGVEDMIVPLRYNQLGIPWINIIGIQIYNSPVGNIKSNGGSQSYYKSIIADDYYREMFTVVKIFPGTLDLCFRNGRWRCKGITKDKIKYPEILSCKYKKED